MTKKAALEPTCPDQSVGWDRTRNCRTCAEYSSCDACNKPVCYFVSVNVNDDELECRDCVQKLGFTKEEVMTGVVVYDIDKSGKQVILAGEEAIAYLESK